MPDMKPDLLDVLVYFFENDFDIHPDRQAVLNELVQQGFEQDEVDSAFEWFDSLEDETAVTSEGVMRVFHEDEMALIPADCRGLIISLEQLGILTADQRELVIDRALVLAADCQLVGEELNAERLKWVVLMILSNRPCEDIAYAFMEEQVYNSGLSAVH